MTTQAANTPDVDALIAAAVRAALKREREICAEIARDLQSLDNGDYGRGFYSATCKIASAIEARLSPNFED